jgi:hypothetical protein
METTDYDHAPESAGQRLGRAGHGAAVPGFIFADATDAVIVAHRERQQALMESSNAILNRAEGETRDLTDQERTEIDGLTAEFDGLEREIALRERVNSQNALLTSPRGRQTDPDPMSSRSEPARQPQAAAAASAGPRSRRASRHRARQCRLPPSRRLRQLGPHGLDARRRDGPAPPQRGRVDLRQRRRRCRRRASLFRRTSAPRS